eukprot:Nitzschia sp. Nitz4//scaffold13_size275219//44947//46965//NITZ4_000847-RA/size275219-processed-gene-0.130-mRNA-1//-1//CDS//3329535933//2925//frame0
MVESETFVSRRKNTEHRPRRKLFTARGLDLSGEGPLQQPNKQIEEPAKQLPSPSQDHPTKQSTQLQKAQPQVPTPVESASKDDWSEATEHDYSNGDLSSYGDGALSSKASWEEEDLFKEMGYVMKSLFYPLQTPYSHSMKGTNANRNDVSVPGMKLLEKLAPTERSLEKTLSQLNCSGIRPLEQQLRTTINDDAHQLPFHPKTHAHYMQPDPNGYSFAYQPELQEPNEEAWWRLEEPPLTVYVGEQPCLSEELIPVDDLPVPGNTFDLTRFHPKPLAARPNYATTGKALLSMDSEDSETGPTKPKETHSNPLSPRDQNQGFAKNPRVSVAPETTPKRFMERNHFDEESDCPSLDKIQSSAKSPKVPVVPPVTPRKQIEQRMQDDGFPSFDEAGPSFDENEADQGEIPMRSPTFKKVASPVVKPKTFFAEKAEVPTMRSPAVKKAASPTTREFFAEDDGDIPMLPAVKKVASPMVQPATHLMDIPTEITSTDSNQTESSSASIASDEAIAQEYLRIRKNQGVPYTPDFHDSPNTHVVANVSSEYSMDAKHDENRRPWSGVSQASKSIRAFGSEEASMKDAVSTAATTSTASTGKIGNAPSVFLSVASTRDINRRSLDLKVKTSMPLSPKMEEFYSPKTGATPTHQYAMGERRASQFAFDESFDESEFFEPIGA